MHMGKLYWATLGIVLFWICALNAFDIAKAESLSDAIPIRQKIIDKYLVNIAENLTITDTPLSYIVEDPTTKKKGFIDKASGYYQSPLYDEVRDMFALDGDSPILVGIKEKYGYASRSSGQLLTPLQFVDANINSEFAGEYVVIGVYDSDLILDDPSLFSEWHYQLLRKDCSVVEFPQGIYPCTNDVEQDRLCITDEETIGLGSVFGDVLLAPSYEEGCISAGIFFGFSLQDDGTYSVSAIDLLSLQMIDELLEYEASDVAIKWHIEVHQEKLDVWMEGFDVYSEPIE